MYIYIYIFLNYLRNLRLYLNISSKIKNSFQKKKHIYTYFYRKLFIYNKNRSKTDKLLVYDKNVEPNSQ